MLASGRLDSKNDEVRLKLFGLIQATYWNELALQNDLLIQVSESA
jgi:hypothetical protein